MKEIYRKPKKTDHEEIEKAFNLLSELIFAHPEIESTLWCSACWSFLIEGYMRCDLTYEQFCRECESVKAHYKHWFENPT